MLLAVGGLMVSLIMPGRAVPTLAITVAATTIRAIRNAIKKPPNNAQSSQDHPGSVSGNITLEWENVSCKLSTKSKGSSTTKILLDNVSGTAKPGRIFAILGPSGAGKTTLLNTLAGRLPASKSINIYGSVTCNGVSINSSPCPVAYVTQEDIFFSQLSLQETFDMAAKMRLPKSMSAEEKNVFVNTLIRKLGLSTVTETRVGDEKNRGISGGERKRLSLGCELISTPRLILCDEPTSGLDAFQAEKVMLSLKTLAEAGHTVVCSIHQPSSSILKIVDDIALLAHGQIVYSGSKDDAPAHFEKAGYPMPEQCNPAERYLDLISIDFSSEDNVTTSNTRIEKLFSTWRSATKPKSEQGHAYSGADNAADAVVEKCGLGPFGRIGLLLRRAWRQITRDKKTNMSRFMSSFMSALLFGAIYWRIGGDQAAIQDRLGLLQVCAINTAMTSLVKTLYVFPRESVLVNRERARGSYSILEYFISKLFAEMAVSAFFPLVFSLTVYPMVRLSGGIGRILRFMSIITLESFTAASYGLAIGAIMPSTEAAIAVGPASFVLQIVFGGLYITDANVPNWARWIPRISLIKHSYEGLCVNEFRGLEFETKKPWDVKKGEQVLQRMSWSDSTVLKSCISQGRVIAFYYLFTYAVLCLKKPRYESLQALENKPQPEEEVKAVEAPPQQTSPTSA